MRERVRQGMAYERRQRSAHQPPYVCVDTFLRLSCVEKREGVCDVRERSEFSQYQTYQLHVRVVVLGVLKHTVFWA